MSSWDPDKYMKVGNERGLPSSDLINSLSDISPERIMDIGCGPGNSTKKLAERFKSAEIIGIDSSAEMLLKAEKALPGAKFMKCNVPGGLCDIPGKFDLIFSNACIHWIPDHPALLRVVFDKLNSGGTLAVQIPLTDRALFYRILNRLVNTEKWQKLRNIKNFHSLEPEGYYDELSALSGNFRIWETVYYHTVASADEVVDWYKGSGLRPYLEALSDGEKDEFLTELTSSVDGNSTVQKDGRIILKMPRLFFTAAK